MIDLREIYTQCVRFTQDLIMDAPKCRLCGERHYGLCQKFKTKEAVRKIVDPRPTRETHCTEAVIPIEEADPAGIVFDRKAYQRDYMKKARAQGKYKRK